MRRLTVILTLLVGVLFLSGPAAAQKVGNPGSFSAKLVNGALKVKANEFGFDESQNVSFSGTVDKAGNINIPSIVFPDTQLNDVPVVGSVTVKINVVNPTTGTINPITGAMSLRLRVWIKIDGIPLGGGCRVGSAASPIDINTLITGTTNPPGPNTPITGIPYSATNGTVQVVNNSFAVPASSDCGIGSGSVDDLVNSPAGNNRAAFDLRFTPVLAKGINPVLNANPASATAPATVTLSAAGTTAPAGIASYQWDFDGNGFFDRTTTTNSTSFEYTSGGAFNAKVRVTDSEGDSAEATRQVAVAAYPDLAIGATHGPFRVGGTGTYRVTVRNDGYAATSGPTTVRATLPAGLTYSGVAGSGWSCAPDGADVLCSRTASIARNASAPDLELSVAVGRAALGTVTPSFRVSTTGDNGPANDTVGDPTLVTGTDLAIEKTHAVHGMVIGADPANRFAIEVRNVGDAASAGPVTVTDTLPAGLGFVSAAGAGWDCGEAGGTVTCSRSDSVAPGQVLPAIDLRVSGSLAEGETAASVVNRATVATSDDVEESNDASDDPTLILDGPDLAIAKSHEANFVAGSHEEYTLAVRNDGPKPTTGPTTVTDDLPEGLTFVAATGEGWSCSELDGTVTCDRGAIAAGQDAPPVTLTVAVGESAIPEVTNAASVSTPDDGNPANDIAEDPTLVRAIDVTVEKSHEGVFRTDRNGSYRLAVTNVGDSVTAGPVSLTDVLPDELGFVSAAGEGWECDEVAGTVSCEYADGIGPSSSAPPVRLTVYVTGEAAPTVANTATVDTVDDFNPANDSDTDEALVVDQDAAVSIRRNGSFEIGGRGTYLVSVDNEGSKPTTGPIAAEVDLADGLVPVSAGGNGWACDAEAGTITCVRAAALAGETAAPDISVRVDVGETTSSPIVTGTTVSTPGDRNPDNDVSSDETSIATPDLDVSLVGPSALRVGADGSFGVEIVNRGGGATTGPVDLTAPVPAGLEFRGAAGDEWTCDPIGSSVECSLTRAIQPEGSAPNLTLVFRPTAAALAAGQKGGEITAGVAIGTPGDSVSENDETTAVVPLTAVDLGVSVTGDESVSAGGSGALEVTVDGLGTAPSQGPVKVVADFPTGLEPLSATGEGWNCGISGGTVTCRSSDVVPAGGSGSPIELGFRAGRDASGDHVTQVGLVTPDDVDPANDSASTITAVGNAPDLEAALTTRPVGSFSVGGPAALRATVTNRGTAPTGHETVLTFTPGPGLAYASATGAGWNCTGEGAITCVRTQSLAPGARAAVEIGLTASKPGPGEPISSVSAFTVGDADAANDRAEAPTPVEWIDLAISRKASGTWAAASRGTYAVTVRNTGTGATDGPVLVRETLPAGTGFSGATGAGWDCLASGRDLACRRDAALAGGASANLEVTLDLGAAAVPGIDATSTVSTDGDIGPANDTATERIPVAAAPAPEARRLPVTISSARVKALADGSLRIGLTCPAEATEKCRGVLNLVSASKVNVAPKGKKAKKSLLNLGSVSYAIATGRTAPVRVVMPKKARAVLKRVKKVAARATAVSTSPGVVDATARINISRP